VAEPTHDIPAEVILAAQTKILSIIEKTTPPEGFDEPCWLAPTAKGWNYGFISFRAFPGGPSSGRWLTHRLAYTAWVGPIPDGLVIDHLCEVKACCNPAHLSLATNRENTQRIHERAYGPDRCRRGHARTPENTYTRSNGRRTCRVCWNDRRRERRAEKKAGTWKPKPATPHERFMQYVRLDSCGCWLWMGGKTSHEYGKFKLDGRNVRAHRASYELFVGPIPEGLTIDHTCNVRLCVNPEHLEAVTGAENTMRSSGPTALNARKTECVNGHPFDEANTYVLPNGGRACRTCQRAWYERKKDDPEYRAKRAAQQRAYRARKKAERLAAEGGQP